MRRPRSRPGCRRTKAERTLLRLAQKATPLFPADASLQERCEALGSNSKSPSQSLTSQIYERIRTVAGPSPKTGAIDIRVLTRQLWLRMHCDGVPAQDVLLLLGPLGNAINQQTGKLPPIDEEATWLELLRLAKTYVRCISPSLNRPDARLRIVGNSINELRRRGYDVRIRNGEPDVHYCEKQLANDIDQRVGEIGGLALAEWIFRQLTDTFDPRFGRYLVVPPTFTYSTGKETPIFPFGYLLNLAAKHAGRPESSSQNAFDETLELAKHYAVMFDVQPYYAMHGIFNDRSSIIRYLRETAAYDSLFSFAQTNPKNIKRRLSGLLDPIDQHGWIEEDFGVPLAQLTAVLDATLIRARRGPIVVSPAVIAPKLGMTTEKVTRVLDMVSCVQWNTQFKNPLRVESVDLQEKPLRKLGDGYLLLDASVGAAAMLEALLSVLRREPSRKIDELVGREGLENYVNNELENRNCSPASGRYKSTTEGEAECDSVVETADVIVTLEVKKKALTKLARSTAPLPILVDLARSVLHGHCQTGRHELVLHREGTLALNRVVKRNGRKVERVAVSLHHFGCFHSRTHTMQLLNLMTGAVFSATDLERDNDRRGLRELNNHCKRLEQLCERAEEHGLPEPARYFNCWFLSLDILDAILTDTSDPESFWATLSQTRHVSYGTRNWFSEYKQIKRIRASSASS